MIGQRRGANARRRTVCIGALSAGLAGLGAVATAVRARRTRILVVCCAKIEAKSGEEAIATQIIAADQTQDTEELIVKHSE